MPHILSSARVSAAAHWPLCRGVRPAALPQDNARQGAEKAHPQECEQTYSTLRPQVFPPTQEKHETGGRKIGRAEGETPGGGGAHHRTHKNPQGKKQLKPNNLDPRVPVRQWEEAHHRIGQGLMDPIRWRALTLPRAWAAEPQEAAVYA